MDTESQCVSLLLEYKLVYTKRLQDVTTHILTAEGVGAQYRRNVQQYLLILILYLRMEPGLLNDAKNEGGSQILK